MPINMQIAVIKRILPQANPWLTNLDFVPIEGEGTQDWAETLDDSVTLPENIYELERRFPLVRWRVPEKKRISPDKAKRWERTQMYAGPKRDSYFQVADVLVKPHKVKAKGKTYLHGRIQLTLDQEMIGRRARVSVVIPRVYSPEGAVIPLEGKETTHWKYEEKPKPRARKAKRVRQEKYFEF